MIMLGNNHYQVDYLETVLERDIKKLDHSVRRLIKQAIETRLMIDPIGFGKPLWHSLKGHRRLRVGDYRIVYRIQAETKTVLIVAIRHRRELYDS